MVWVNRISGFKSKTFVGLRLTFSKSLVHPEKPIEATS